MSRNFHTQDLPFYLIIATTAAPDFRIRLRDGSGHFCKELV
jgi:hypothetical protein